MKVTDLIPDERNANKGTQRGLKALDHSLRQYGAGRSILIDKHGRVIAGNKTVERAADIGLDDVIVVQSDGTKLVAVQRTDLDLETDPAARELAWADNRVGQLDLDWEPLQLAADLEAGLDLSNLFDPAELSEILERAGSELLEGKAEPPEVTETEAEKLAQRYGVQLGQVWQLGRHKIACVDSLDEAAIKGLVGGDEVGMVWSDPPYGIAIVAANVSVGGGEAYDIPFGGVKNRIAKGLGSTDGAKPFGSKEVRGSVGAANLVDVGKYAPVIGDDTTETAIKAAELYLSLWAKACHIWWGGNYYANKLPPSPGWIVWDKDNTGNFADCELAWTNQKRPAQIFEHRWNGMLKASEQGQRRIHPTQKPVALARWCFENYGKPGDLILDPFLGSGISVLAAEQLDDDRRVIGCELSPAYIGATIFRWADLTGRQPVLLSNS